MMFQGSMFTFPARSQDVITAANTIVTFKLLKKKKGRVGKRREISATSVSFIRNVKIFSEIFQHTCSCCVMWTLLTARNAGKMSNEFF